MKYLIILLLPISLIAQDIDPNAKVKEMGLSENQISTLCQAAIGKIPKRTDWGIYTIMEYMYGYEGKPYPDFPSKKEAHEWLAEIWDEKYACVYCKITSSITGSLDMMALYHEKQNWVYALYDPEGVFKAPINKIRIINDYLEIKGTLLDYLYYVTEEKPTREVEGNPAFKNSLDGMKARLIEHGAKRMKDMTPKEIEENSQ
ncbi:hypothetical protein SAMN05421640_1348 [Ekhidna lutea]|uniref:Uncharacterized protein n=1 Tax=Ekhidna lutea TaxID=447679 RepID=A0A239HK50_EKHLU|nr:hypothetical protein [Ekhidna lutea]SNS81448.1 hypothetical protein SAMN05421640_1348 [Ekhidna lutea]